MASRTSRKIKIIKQGRTPGSYAAWPHACAKSSNYRSLSPHAKALLLDFLGQFTGYNNGDLCCAWKLMEERGWRSRTTVEKARTELETKGWIVRTRQGWRNKANLYALTIFKIDEFAKLDVRETAAPLGFWKDGRNPWLEDQRSSRPKGTAIASTKSCATPEQTCTADGQPLPRKDIKAMGVASQLVKSSSFQAQVLPTNWSPLNNYQGGGGPGAVGKGKQAELAGTGCSTANPWDPP